MGNHQLFRRPASLLAGICCLLAFLLPARVEAQCPINAVFTASNVYINQGQNVTFTNASTGTIAGNAWYDNGVLFSTAASPNRTFNVPGFRTIALVITNGSCLDTAVTVINVSPTLSASITSTNPTCFNGTNGSIDLTPAGGHQNVSVDNNRAINDYSVANTVTGAGYTNGITVEAWVKPRSTWLTGDGLFVAFNTQSGTYNRFFIGYNPGFQQFVYFDDNVGNQFQNSTAARGQWHHVAVTVSNTNVMNMYINGVLRKTATTNSGWIPQPGELFNMGQEWDFSGSLVTSQHFDGNIDEVRIWNTALTPATLSANYSGCMSVNPTHPNWPNLVAYYSMNEGSGTYLFDRSGRNNHANRVNGSAYGTVPQTNWGCFSSGTGYGYNWSTGATTQDVTGLAAGAYSVTVTDGGGANAIVATALSNPAQVVVSFNPAGPLPICAGGSTTLNASGANTYSWSPATGLSGTTGPSVTASPSLTTTYTCVGTNAVGCTGSNTIQVVVNPLPTAGITGTNVICDGQGTTLTATGGSTYAWSNGVNVATNPVSPTTTTTYTVTVTDANTCTDTETMTVTVNPLPTVSFSGQDTICNGDSTTVTASGGTSYNWANGPTTPSQTVAPSAATTYVVTVTDANTCSRADSITVIVNALPVLSFAGDDTICMGDTTFITVSGGDSYAWGHGPSNAMVDLSPPASAYFDVTTIDTNGCFATDSVLVTVNALPTALLAGNDTLCAGDSTTLTASGGDSYLWTTGDVTSAITVAPAVTATYGVTAIDSNGCEDDETITVTVNSLPVVTITGNDTICEGDTTSLTASGGVDYLWDGGSVTATITVGPTATTPYSVTATDLNGCEGTAGITVVVNPLPTAPTITQSGNTMSVPGGFSSYQWFLNGNPIPGATSDSYTGTQDGNYSVLVSNAEGCSVQSADYPFIYVAISQVGATQFTVGVYPNPNGGRFTIRMELDRDRAVSLRIHDLAGKQVWSMDAEIGFGEWMQEVDLGNVSKGSYLLEVSSDGQRTTRKLVLQ